ncbi:hypothetical protein X805_41570 [Sphaerotilus natans subsp. natans DSM 6575]|uniref:Uncharacterized protein n=1 Tax=Sphaerotilus natans subsp. natans DSM 6575 TaxID=1286631 RepID=A0A059KGL6_9BURK|nr:hypothetical protein X805_41570 [Sphaerotilus natans subsp. natans DSM 6575]
MLRRVAQRSRRNGNRGRRHGADCARRSSDPTDSDFVKTDRIRCNP